GFGHDTGYELTNRTIQELQLYPSARNRIPDEVINRLKALKKEHDEMRKSGEEVHLNREQFLSAIQVALSKEQWDAHKDTISRIPAPIPINPYLKVLLVLLFSVVGMGGSYWVAWYGIRVNTYANCRTAFASLRGEPWDVVNIPLRAGMSIGLFLISLELVMM